MSIAHFHNIMAVAGRRDMKHRLGFEVTVLNGIALFIIVIRYPE